MIAVCERAAIASQVFGTQLGAPWWFFWGGGTPNFFSSPTFFSLWKVSFTAMAICVFVDNSHAWNMPGSRERQDKSDAYLHKVGLGAQFHTLTFHYHLGWAVGSKDIGARCLKLRLAVVASKTFVVNEGLRHVYWDLILQVGHILNQACGSIEGHRDILQRSSIKGLDSKFYFGVEE